ncbi:hypothetical protein BDA96_09G048300 [Sorghum bicolor]|uniref:Secreted protein n=1 Tax=Sorghum bicolor TaxID=4558 RepID=A0A921QB22_SORBI|nr:hypothetical protein BDA96_09G048300 [Sorghum bicolor]
MVATCCLAALLLWFREGEALLIAEAKAKQTKRMACSVRVRRVTPWHRSVEAWSIGSVRIYKSCSGSGWVHWGAC